jgi:acetylglutamate kinase
MPALMASFKSLLAVFFFGINLVTFIVQFFLCLQLDAPEAERLIQESVITGGMIPKVRCALDAVAAGVEQVHVIDGRRRHALLLELFTDRGVGTEIRRPGARRDA